jgi:hypothetical protein
MVTGFDISSVEINRGDRVCFTELIDIHEHDINDEDQCIGQLTVDIIEGMPIIVRRTQKGDKSLETDSVVSVFKSFTFMVIKTTNSMYIVEKLNE